jgi:hypothetical protein
MFLEKNKLECLTARNSLEKLTYSYKILNTENNKFNSGKLITTDYPNQHKPYQYKKNLYLSPNHGIMQTTNLYSTTKSKKEFDTKKQIFNRMTTPLKTPQNKILVTEPYRDEKEKEISSSYNLKTDTGSKDYANNNNIKSSKRKENLKIIFNNPFEFKTSNNNNKGNNNLNVNGVRVDFQNLKNFKK